MSSDVQPARQETMIINMGPQHPSTHGVLRLVLELDGEYVISARPVLGYLHTGIEKNTEYRTWQQGVTFVTRGGSTRIESCCRTTPSGGTAPKAWGIWLWTTRWPSASRARCCGRRVSGTTSARPNRMPATRPTTFRFPPGPPATASPVTRFGS